MKIILLVLLCTLPLIVTQSLETRSSCGVTVSTCGLFNPIQFQDGSRGFTVSCAPPASPNEAPYLDLCNATLSFFDRTDLPAGYDDSQLSFYTGDVDEDAARGRDDYLYLPLATIGTDRPVTMAAPLMAQAKQSMAAGKIIELLVETPLAMPSDFMRVAISCRLCSKNSRRTELQLTQEGETTMTSATTTTDLETRGSLRTWPTIQSLGMNTALITWIQYDPKQAGKLVIRETNNPSSLPITFNSGVAGAWQRIKATGLKSFTQYTYSVWQALDSAPMATGTFRTFPQQGTAASYRVAFMGDTGCCNKANCDCNGVVKGMDTYAGSNPIQHYVFLGDNAYPNGDDADYARYFFDKYRTKLLNTPFWSVPGNHERASGITASGSEFGPYFDRFKTPRSGEGGGVMSGSGAYWSYTYGRVHVVGLDSYFSLPTPANKEKMKAWLRADLAAAKTANCQWLIAVYHHPPYSRGANSDHANEFEMPLMKAEFQPILEAAGVDVILGGHSHVYERSMLVNGSYARLKSPPMSGVLQNKRGDSSNPYVKPAGLQPYKGVVCVVVGASAIQTTEEQITNYSAGLNHPFNVKFGGRNGSIQIGGMVIDINGNMLIARYITPSGTIYDEFVIQKV